MKERVLKNWISTILGLVFQVLAIYVAYNPPSELEVTWPIVSVISFVGILLILAKDSLVEIIKNKFSNGK